MRFAQFGLQNHLRVTREVKLTLRQPSSSWQPSPEDKEFLTKISWPRVFAVKDCLSETRKLDPDSFFISNPDVEMAERGLPPRVDLSL